MPPIKVGKLVLNRNPLNYFADVEQAAFGPSNLVPGIRPPLRTRCTGTPSPTMTPTCTGWDELHLIPVNAPKFSPEKSYQRDGSMRVDGNGGGQTQIMAQQHGRTAPDSQFLEPAIDLTDRRPAMPQFPERRLRAAGEPLPQGDDR